MRFSILVAKKCFSVANNLLGYTEVFFKPSNAGTHHHGNYKCCDIAAESRQPISEAKPC